MEKNVIVTVFKVESEGYQALSELKMNTKSAAYQVSAAALVKKERGLCTCLDGFDTGEKTTNDTAIGGLVGMMVGILGGPVGMLLGAGYGALIGMAVDAEDAAYEVSMLEDIANKLDDDMVALIALADEENTDALDAKFSAYDTIIARFDADVVADEVDTACEMQREMARQTRMKLRKDRKEKFQEELEVNKEILKNNFRK